MPLKVNLPLASAEIIITEALRAGREEGAAPAHTRITLSSAHNHSRMLLKCFCFVFFFVLYQGMMPLTVVVLDSGGHVIAMKREDGSGIMRNEIAIGKAYVAVVVFICFLPLSFPSPFSGSLLHMCGSSESFHDAINRNTLETCCVSPSYLYIYILGTEHSVWE